jgi:REP element-mobilizing transposase RayT
MARGPRLDAPGSLHHVIVRGIERRKIFESDKDREDFLTRLGRVVKEEQATCFAWVLMPNHAHILLRTGTTPLAKMMKRLLTGYAVSFNRRHQRSGHLFQNRYKSIVCEEDSYLLELIRYIHLNSIRTGLVRDIDELGRYRWCGHSVLMGKDHRPWQAKEEVLSYFSQRKGVARRKYRQFVLEGIPLGRRAELTGGGVRQNGEKLEGKFLRRLDHRILGSGAFVEKLLAEEERMVRQRTLFRRKRINVEKFMDLISEKFGVTREEVIGGGQRQAVSVARSVFCYLASKDLGLTGRELSRALRLTPSAIHYAVLRGEKFLAEHKGVKVGLYKYLNNLTTSP